MVFKEEEEDEVVEAAQPYGPLVRDESKWS